MTFEEFSLHPRLLRAVQKAGYEEPTPIQEKAIPLILAGQDLIGTAQTGTGKTAAFMLPILQHLIDAPRHKTQAVIITPTRELAEQIHEAIGQLAEFTNIRSAAVYGGVSPKNQIRALKSGVEILVVCPGRFLDLSGQGFGSFSAVKTVVLDEADRMLDMGFFPDVRRILSQMPKKRQTLMFSATFPREVEQLAAEALHQPQRVTLALAKPVHTVSHALYPVAPHLKTPLLLELLQQTEARSILIFTRTKHRAQKLAEKLSRSGRRATSLHGDLSQAKRQAALKGFRSGAYQIMVATDLAARGLDIARISHVINYDMPLNPDDYIHRIGRTGRAERTGQAYTLTTPEDRSMVRTLEKIIGKPLEHRKLEHFDYSRKDPAVEERRTVLPDLPRSREFQSRRRGVERRRPLRIR
ncbi:MAG: DEAD/DEAH box helicase [candidate division KSB1 bacterium]|nr:DEAD/DEAH box helicase [candidate division KSB1 bacterium]MDZ7346621.1 DEAD/DEAH box helicase [candidate division KSB1 bacterium]